MPEGGCYKSKQIKRRRYETLSNIHGIMGLLPYCPSAGARGVGFAAMPRDGIGEQQEIAGGRAVATEISLRTTGLPCKLPAQDFRRGLVCLHAQENGLQHPKFFLVVKMSEIFDVDISTFI